MSDIYSDLGNINTQRAKRAADEIERLRSNFTLTALHARIAEQSDEIERLREALRRIAINTNDNGSGAAEFAAAALTPKEKP